MHFSSRGKFWKVQSVKLSEIYSKQTDQIKLIEGFDQIEIRNQLCMEPSPAHYFWLPILPQCDQIVLINLLSEIYQTLTQRFTLFQVYWADRGGQRKIKRILQGCEEIGKIGKQVRNIACKKSMTIKVKNLSGTTGTLILTRTTTTTARLATTPAWSPLVLTWASIALPPPSQVYPHDHLDRLAEQAHQGPQIPRV